MEDETLPTAATPRRRRRERLALGALLFFFAAITAFFANFHPSHGRFYDERFALQNVHSVLQRQAFEPANGYYPTLSYMPQTLALGFLEAYGQRSEGRSWIYRETPPPSADVLPPAAGRAFTPLAYRVSRGVQILWGLLTLVALFALGRRAFGAAAAGVGVTLLALTPWFMLSAAKFKPDAALLATSVLALWLSARASERPFSWRGYAAAGAAIAAAMSCKLTGGLTALPLTAVAIAQALRERRRLAGLATAGATSLALFLIANPHLLFYLHFMQRLSSEYEDKAKAYGGTHLGVAGSSLELVVSREGFGPIFGALALVGFVILGLRGWRRGGALRRPSAAILWLFAPIYLAAFAASTPHFKPNNVLSTLPPLALIAGWLTVDLGRRMAFAARERGPQTRLARAALGLAVAAALAFQARALVIFVHESVVPTTQDAALRWLEGELGRRPQHVLSVDQAAERYRWEGQRLRSQLSLARFPWSEEALGAPQRVYDGVIGPPELVESGPWASQPGVRFEPVPLRLRGPAVSVRARGWSRLGDPVPPAAEAEGGSLRVVWPEQLGTGWFSLEVWVPERTLAELEKSVLVSGQALPLVWRQGVGQGHLLTTPRFRVGVDQALPTIELEIPPKGPDSIVFALYSWRPLAD